MNRWEIFLCLFFVCLLPFSFMGPCLGLTDEEILKHQTLLRERRTGDRIAFWAERFVGTPYDRDPQGEYVTKSVIIADERVDCMYLTFRAVELALSRTPEEAVQVALERRFHSRGVLKEGKVVNYGDRFEYGEDMIFSGKWGTEITPSIGRTEKIRGSRGRASVEILPTDELIQKMDRLKNGDLLFFIKDPKKRLHEEIVGHIGFIQKDQEVFLIHAAGTKGKGGEVKKVQLKDYLKTMPFIGVMITRFD